MNRKPIIVELASGAFPSIYGEFQMHSFTDGKDEAIVLSKGDIWGADGVLCRIQSECISSQVFFGTICDCREQMVASLQMINDEGRGVVIYLHQEGRGNGAAAHIGTLDFRKKGIPQGEAYRALGYHADRRDFGIAAKVLEYFGIKSVRLITGNVGKRKAIEKNNIDVAILLHYSGQIIRLGEPIRNVVAAIEDGKAESPIPATSKQKRVLVLGDLNLDYQIPGIAAGEIINKPEPKVGGTGFNAALAFFDHGLMPILFGKVGDDQQGRRIQEELKDQDFYSLLGVHPTKPTGTCSIVFFQDTERWLMQDTDNANDYDLENLEQALKLSQIGEDDIIFVVAHSFFRSTVDHSAGMFSLLNTTGAKIILDVVPHKLYETVTLEDLNRALGKDIFALIAGFPTFMNFLGTDPSYEVPRIEDYKKILSEFRASMIIVRYGRGTISKQTICYSPDSDTYEFVERDVDTGYENTPDEEKRGFGDRLTAKLTEKLVRDGRL